MSMQKFSRGVAILFFVALVAGCSSTKTSSGDSGSGRSSATSSTSTSARTGNNCASNRQSCMFNGSYEPGERAYAEQAAKDLNNAEYERLRRAFEK
jgi:hypothetical protein